MNSTNRVLRQFVTNSFIVVAQIKQLVVLCRSSSFREETYTLYVFMCCVSWRVCLVVCRTLPPSPTGVGVRDYAQPVSRECWGMVTVLH